MRRSIRSTCPMSRPSLVLFDVDGTLVDSQGDIHAAMTCAYEDLGLDAPTREEVKSIVGLSLPVAMEALVPSLSTRERDRMVATYKESYMVLRAKAPIQETSPLFPGIRDVLDWMRSEPWLLLGIATGKSQRGLDKLLAGHELDDFFITRQVADHHPSKPHPSMVLTALSETGVDPDAVVLIGDTTFDMQMGRNAGIKTIGVSWGYHPVDRLAADGIATKVEELPSLVSEILEI